MMDSISLESFMQSKQMYHNGRKKENSLMSSFLKLVKKSYLELHVYLLGHFVNRYISIYIMLICVSLF